MIKPNMLEPIEKDYSVTTHPSVVADLQSIRKPEAEPCFGEIMTIM